MLSVSQSVTLWCDCNCSPCIVSSYVCLLLLYFMIQLKLVARDAHVYRWEEVDYSFVIDSAFQWYQNLIIITVER